MAFCQGMGNHRFNKYLHITRNTSTSHHAGYFPHFLALLRPHPIIPPSTNAHGSDCQISFRFSSFQNGFSLYNGDEDGDEDEDGDYGEADEKNEDETRFLRE